VLVPVARGQSQLHLEDRILAVVDEDPILASDVERVIRLELARPDEGEDEEGFRGRVLRDLIEQRLRFHEVDRFGLLQVPVSEIEAGTEEIRSRFSTEEAFQRSLAELRMSEQDLRQLVARQLTILAFVDERLGARVFVGLEEIQRYYDDELVPALRQRQELVPPIEDVREMIRILLREQRMLAETRRWTEELAARADIINYFDRSGEELPPVVETIRGEKPSP